MKHLLPILILLKLSRTEDVFDIRIHEGADSGSRMTMSSELQKATEPLGSCFGQLESEIDWIEWRSSRSAFYTITHMPISATKASSDLVGTLHLLCAGNKMHSFPFRVHVTHRNHHPPEFTKKQYTISVPINLPLGANITKFEVTDMDPVIYNSERKLSFTKKERTFGIRQDGTLVLLQDLSTLIPYKPINIQILAIDFGSPQLFSKANVTLIPVTVSEVRAPHVNIAKKEYQIFEWEAPEYGKAEKFRLSVRKSGQVIYEEEVDGSKSMVLTKMVLTSPNNIDFKVSAIDSNGETSTEWQPIGSLDKNIRCEGQCSEGGLPLCYQGAFNRIEQFVDSRGAHCLCYPGYIGVSCQNTDKCPSEKTVDLWGGIDWKEVEANTTLRLPCPYNAPSDHMYLERKCLWNPETGRATWQKPYEKGRCTHQTSVLTHLGMMGTFSARATSVSAINTVTSFIEKLLIVPAFARNITKFAHYDQKIAETAVMVMDSIIQTDLTRLQGNTSVLRKDTWEVLEKFVETLPVPYSLSSPDTGIYMKSIELVKKSDPHDNLIGKRCRAQIPSSDENQTVRFICASNATLFDLLDPKSPVLAILTENNAVFTRLTVMLKAPDSLDNYTCVYFDENEQAWSTKGIRRITPNYHGYVKCEANHVGVFALLPDRLFYNGETFWTDLAAHMPTVTSFVALICSILLLFMAAVQKNQTIDFAFLLYLFFVFMVHLVHLLFFVAPQVGEPFAFTSLLHFVLQFCVLSTSSLLSLVMFSIHTTIVEFDNLPKESQKSCFTKPCHVVLLGILVPSLFTFSTYYFLDGRDLDVSIFLERIDWLFLTNYLLPVTIVLSVCVVYAVWNIYLGSTSKNNRRGTTERFLSLSPAISASLTALFMIFFYCAVLVLFFFRDHSPMVVLAFCVLQFFHVICAFFFASYLFRLRFLLERGLDGSTQSLERKRDISRALLDHVDTKSDVTLSHDGGFGEAGFESSVRTTYTPPSDHYLSGDIQTSIFQRAPMVSIV